jgi:hypothetical protein
LEEQEENEEVIQLAAMEAKLKGGMSFFTDWVQSRGWFVSILSLATSAFYHSCNYSNLEMVW